MTLTSIWLGLVVLVAATAPVRAQTFSPVQAYETGPGSGPLGVAVADVNSDGWADLLVALYSSNAVGVLLGTGPGTFAPVVTYPAGRNSPMQVVVADVNADGHPDVLTANLIGGTVGVLLGSGTGTFAPLLTYSTGAGTTPWALAVADVNADGWPDLVTANGDDQSVGVLLNTGTGAFALAARYPVGDHPQSVALADVDGDGYLDLLASRYYGSNVYVFGGSRTGTFRPGPFYQASGCSRPEAVIVADLNRDGRPDAVAAYYSGSVGVLLNQGNGVLQPLAVVATEPNSTPTGLAVADVNGDGWPDVCTANMGTDAVALLLGNGDGTLDPLAVVATGPQSRPHAVVLADVNGDGRLDLVTALFGSSQVGVVLNATGALLPNLAAATPAAGPVGTPVTLVGAHLKATTAVTFNGVSAAFAVASDSVLTCTVPAGARSGRIQVLTGAGRSRGVPFAVGAALAVADAGPGEVRVYPNPAAGAFTVAWPAGGRPGPVAATLWNPLGQPVARQMGARSAAAGELHVSLPALAPGLYWLRVEAGGAVRAQRVVIR